MLFKILINILSCILALAIFTGLLCSWIVFGWVPALVFLILIFVVAIWHLDAEENHS